MFNKRVIAIMIGLSFFSWARTDAQPRPTSTIEGEVLTRGPVHEAFAETVTFDPEPGIIVPTPPPASIEEYPPDQRPDGDNVAWIPGYWAWDDSRDDYIWVSGVWRAMPPGREWVPGYWAQVADGYQWIAGYWSDAAARETEYLPEPPQSIEAGPNVVAPSPDQLWVPGTWIWQGNRYVWQPGYWAQTNPNWSWVPAHYVWSPRGYVFNDGYWDYDLERRGTLFAPVYFEPSHRRSRFSYSPSTMINLSFFSDSFFVRPRYNHYYFGDYYAAGWERAGIYSPYSFRRQYRGYDPLYSHQRSQHRDDREWDRRNEDRYRQRRENARERPPRTWKDQVAGLLGRDKDAKKTAAATRFDEFTKRKDGGVQFRSLQDGDKKSYGQTWQNLNRARVERQQAEKAAKPSTLKTAQPMSTRLTVPKSQLVGKSPAQLGTMGPPRMQSPPKLDSKVTPKTRAPVQPARVVRSQKSAPPPARRDKPEKAEKKEKQKRP